MTSPLFHELHEVSLSTATSAVYYALRLIENRRLVDSLDKGMHFDDLPSEPSPKEQEIALRVLRQIENEVGAELKELSDEDANKYVLQLGQLVRSMTSAPSGADAPLPPKKSDKRSSGESPWLRKLRWNYLVHERLGETLHYYFVQARPFHLGDMRDQLNRLISEQELGSVRVFPIFGQYDLVVRAWLHASVAQRFRESLDALRTVRFVTPFEVQRFEHRWYDEIVSFQSSDLEQLDQDTIQAVQRGERDELLQDLIRSGTVVERPEGTSIQFFVTINIGGGEAGLHAHVAQELKKITLASSHWLNFPSIYTGFGFCKILLKGATSQYHEIAGLPLALTETMKHLPIETETFLVHGKDQISGDETVGQATFRAIRGKSIFVYSILPELYDLKRPHSLVQRVEQFLEEAFHAPKVPLSARDRQFLKDYLRAYIERQPELMAQTVFTFFYAVEGFLRQHHKHFAAKITGLPFQKVFAEAKVAEAKYEGGTQEEPAHSTLGDFLNICLAALRLSGNIDSKPYGGYNELVEVRNELMHGALDVSETWNKTLVRLYSYVPTLRKLIELIEATCEKEYTGVY